MFKILVVDDSRLMLAGLREALLPGGYDIAVTENPLEVPHLIRLGRPDLVLIDLNMPTMRGDVVARIIRKAFGASMVVLLHTEVPADARRLIAGCGADGVVAKSGDQAVVRAAVAAHLQEYTQRVA